MLYEPYETYVYKSNETNRKVLAHFKKKWLKLKYTLVKQKRALDFCVNAHDVRLAKKLLWDFP